MNVPDDLREMLNIASALKSEQERIKSTDEWVGIRELHGFYTTFTPSACVALIERIAALEAENARLSAPVTDAEWACVNYQQGFSTGILSTKEGEHTVMNWQQFTTRELIDALLAARKRAA